VRSNHLRDGRHLSYLSPPSDRRGAGVRITRLFYPGRILLGVGTGEALSEAAATGSFGKYQERADRLSEAIGLIRQLWLGDDVTHDGQYYKTNKARLSDLPTQPVPIYVAAAGPKSARLAGQYGDGWIAPGESLMKLEMHAAFIDQTGAVLPVVHFLSSR